MLKPFPREGGAVARTDGFLPIEGYAAIGEGRSVALSGADGSIDWWCCPNLDSPPLFDRLLSPEEGGYFAITPDEPFTAEIGYRDGSNVHETVFTTKTGRARLTESAEQRHGRAPALGGTGSPDRRPGGARALPDLAASSARGATRSAPSSRATATARPSTSAA